MAGRRAVVVGAGIGGLASGAALARRGWAVTICERAASLEPVGAGISLWPNALRALRALGAADAVRARAALGAGTGVRRPDGRWLARSDVAPWVLDRFGDPLVVLPRPELTDLLVGLLPMGALHTGAEVREVATGDPSTPARVHLTDGEALDADLLVAADGIDSLTRQALFGGHPGPVYAGYTTWRFLAPAPPGAAGSETWGPAGQRFAIVPLGKGQIYCYATAGTPPGLRPDDEAAELRRRFGTWHAPIPAILDALTAAQVLHHDIYELATPLPSFHAGRVALVGDAAHAMTPELGQGGCLALEDAVTLAALVEEASGGEDLIAALARYTGLRFPRTTKLARRSRRTGRLTQASSRPGVAMRDLSARLLGLVPDRLVVRGLDSVLDWRPPDG